MQKIIFEITGISTTLVFGGSELFWYVLGLLVTFFLCFFSQRVINASKSKLLVDFLQCLKEIFGGSGEVLRLKCVDVDFNNETISIICCPVKNHLTGTFPVSNRLLAMVDVLPRKDDRVFPDNLREHRRFVTMRKRTAAIHQNPRLLKVDFTAFRT